MWELIALIGVLVGNLLLFVGERFLGEGDALRVAFSVTGAAVVAAGIGLRAAQAARARGARRAVLLRALPAWLGVAVGLGLYGLTLLGPDTLGADASAALRVGWPIVWFASLVPMLLMELSYRSMAGAQELETRRVFDSGRSGLVIGLVTAWLGVLNYVGSAYDEQIDLRTLKDAVPSGATLQMARELPKPVKVTLFFPPANEVGERIAPYFKALDEASDQLTVEWADQEADPIKAEAMAVRRNGTVVLGVAEDQSEKIILSTDEKQADTYAQRLDSDVQRKLARLGRGERIAYFVVGHGERTRNPDKEDPRGLEGLTEYLKTLNYRIKNLGVGDGLSDGVPENATLVFLLGPRTPLLPREVDALRRYVTGGGSLMVLLDPDVDRAPGMESLLDELGLEVDLTPLANETRFVVLTGGQADRTILYSRRVTRHDSTATLSRIISENNLIFPVTGALKKKSGVKGPDAGGPDVQFTVRTTAGTFPDRNRDLKADPDEKQEDAALVAAVQLPAQGADRQPGRAIVTADADILSDIILANSTGNKQWVADSVRWLERETEPGGEVAAEGDQKIVHTRDEDKAWFYGTVMGVPLLVLIGGIVVRAMRRRQRRGEA